MFGRKRAPVEMIYRHTLATRLTHWTNALAILVLLTSGLQIFNAHPALYWGEASRFADPWVAMVAAEQGGQFVGLTRIGDAVFDTTGVLGFSGEVRGFPAWATLPSYRSLADGRRWHFFFAWVFVINLAIYLAAGLISGHLRRDLLPERDQLGPRHILHEIANHARLRFPRGHEARRYNLIQKVTYLVVIFVVLPLMLLTGLSMSPAFGAVGYGLIELLGGRQSARTLHFISASLIALFVLVHVAMVVAAGAWNNIRAMVTGRFAIERKAA
ncbi:cytochrome b/b6 domain-containing protein [Phenylobacterium sp.]|jgi:thiosulfate reductase cytochrome b subunit|uniref:cytochrome b/b6 domain-containing protein n=1 Tax=Phenylobacterium sp. TaxID=1871053 RepID=UPI002E2F381F|nr:cytochrome b/b6 domain-containing protein [Phenylobacterium sp.]HEX2559885.1 cytochrome b/b6 domain-containing protein [Phenylobacterium sp.]